MQLTLNRQADVPDSTDGPGPDAALIYKSMHKLSHGGGSYVLSLFEQASGEGLVIRAFDRARPETLWLTLSKKQVSSLGNNATRSTAGLAGALARRLRVKVDGATNARRLVLPPVRSAEGGGKKSVPRQGRHTKNVKIPAAKEVAAPPSLPPQQRPPTTTPPATVQEAAAEHKVPNDDSAPENRTQHRPSTKGSTADDLGSMVESEVDHRGGSAGETEGNRLTSGEWMAATEVVDGAVSSDGRTAGPLGTVSGTEKQAVRRLVECTAGGCWSHRSMQLFCGIYSTNGHPGYAGA